MKALITGMNGTVAPAVEISLQEAGHDTAVWDRSRVAIDDADAMERFVEEVSPDWILHIATGPPDWAEALARLAAERGTRFLFTSSVSVFRGRELENRRGAYRAEADLPDAADDYGLYKAECERRVRTVCPDAIIARLGWQIGETPGKNHMLDYLVRTARDHEGRVEASTLWYPSCAFLDDTAEALLKLLAEPERYPSGTYHLNGNPSWTFHEIAEALRRLHRQDWTVVPVTSLARDDRMADDRIGIRSIGERLGLSSR